MHLVATAPLFTPPDLRPLAKDVFMALATARFASVASLMAFAGPLGLTCDILDAWIAAGLLAHRVVQVDALARTDAAYVTLTTKGARELFAAEEIRVDGVSSPRLKRSSQKRSHDLAVGDVALALLALARDRGIDLVGVEADDNKIATSVVELGIPCRPVALKADLYALLRRSSGPLGLLFEVDRGTIAPKKMRDRYAAYLAWAKRGGPEKDFGVKAMRVVTVAPDLRRLEKLHAAALEGSDGKRSGFLVFLKQADVTATEPERLMAPVARSLGTAAPIPLLA